MNIRPVGAELLHEGRQKWKNPVDAFRNFTEAPNNTTLITVTQSFLQSAHNSRNSLPCYNASSTIWRMQNMWSVVIGYVQVHTDNLEIFLLRVQSICTEYRW